MRRGTVRVQKSRADRAIVYFRSGHSDEADLVIGADGIHSAVRSGVTITEAPRYAGYTCWRGITVTDDLSLTESTETWGKEGRFGMVRCCATTAVRSTTGAPFASTATLPEASFL